MIAGIALLIILRHHANIRRLISGQREPDVAHQRLRQALAARELDPQERLDWLRLCRTETIGPISFYAMLRRFRLGPRRARDVAASCPPRRTRQNRHRRSPGREAEIELAALHRAGARLICWGSPLSERARHASRMRRRSSSVLGRGGVAADADDRSGRRAQRIGERPAPRPRTRCCAGSRRARRGLRSRPGIDAAAHLGALETGSVAVVAGGVDVVYPAENRGLYDALTRQGAIIAELPLGTEPQARHFPRRNRIISGMALGVVVVEAAARSGSLITARFALEQGREVFAVPGSPLDPRARGCNDLLRHGATLTETAEDVLSQLGAQLHGVAPLRAVPTVPIPAAPSWSPPAVVEPADSDAGFELILERLGPTPVAVDELVRQCQMSAAAVATLLLELELVGRVERHPGNFVSLR